MALLAPGLVGSKLIPLRVVKRGLGPGRIVARMKLPGSVDGDRIFAETVEHQRARSRAGRDRGLSGKCVDAGNHRDQRQVQEAQLSEKHGARILRLLRIDIVECRGRPRKRQQTRPGPFRTDALRLPHPKGSVRRWAFVTRTTTTGLINAASLPGPAVRSATKWVE